MIVQSHSPPISLRTWIVILAVGVLIFILNIAYTAVNLTLVPISEEIHVDLNNLQWLLSAYVLVWAAFVVPAGRLADLYGKRNALIGGLLIFMVGSSYFGSCSSRDWSCRILSSSLGFYFHKRLA